MLHKKEVKEAKNLPKASGYRIDVAENPDGSANAQAVPVDVSGADAVVPEGTTEPQWTTNSPNILVVVPHWDSPDSFTAHLSPANPPSASGGITVTARSVWAFPSTGPETAIVGTSGKLNVVGDRAHGFKVEVVPAEELSKTGPPPADQPRFIP